MVDRPNAATLYALGDIHGDYQRLVRLLVAAKIVPAAPAEPSRIGWSAGGATLVITGDMIDKGPRPMDVLLALAALQSAARRSGGEVILLAGNHEAEFLAGPDPKKAAQFIADLRSKGIAAADVAACGGDLGELLCSLPFAARVGDWFFSHAGNTAGRPFERVAADLRAGIARDGFASKALLAPDSLLEARLGEENTWFDAAGTTAGDEKRLLASYAAALGVKHIVQGHQHNKIRFGDGVVRQAGEIFQRWGLLFLIDVGMSEGVGDSAGAVLRIEGPQAIAICADGAETPLWNAATNPDSGRAGPCRAR